MFTKVALSTANRSLKDAWERLMRALLGVGRLPATNTDEDPIQAGDLLSFGNAADSVMLASAGEGNMPFIGVCIQSAPADGLTEYQYTGECDARFVDGLTLEEGEQVFVSSEKGLATNVSNHGGAIGTVVDATTYGGLAGDKATIAIAQKTHVMLPAI